MQTGLTSNVLEEVLAERESLIITLLADDFRERALLLITGSAMSDEISVTSFEQLMCFFKSSTFCAPSLWKDSEIGLLRVGACFKHLKFATAAETVDT